MRIKTIWNATWAPEGKGAGKRPKGWRGKEEPHHTVFSAGQGPDTRHVGGGGGGEAVAEPTGQEEDLFKGPQEENA